MTTAKGEGPDFSTELKVDVKSLGNIMPSDPDSDKNANAPAAEIEVADHDVHIEDLEFLPERAETETEEQQPIAQKNPDILQQLILKSGRKLTLETGSESKPVLKSEVELKSGSAGAGHKVDVLRPHNNSGTVISNTKLQSVEPIILAADNIPAKETGVVKVAEIIEVAQKDKPEKNGEIEPKQKIETSVPSNSAVGAKSSEPLSTVLLSNLVNQMSQLSPPAKSILTAIHENANWAKQSSAAVVRTMAQVQKSGAVLQSLHVQLHPVELGSVNLKLRLVQGQMRIDVTVENDAAYQALIADQDGLMNTVRSMGYKIESLSISNPNGQSSLMGQENNQKGDAATGNSKGSNDAYGESDEGTEDTSNSSANIDNQSHIYI